MNLNPEFKRNLWLEISPSRLVIMPMVLGLTALLSWVLGKDNRLETLLITTSTLCIALVAGWGSFAAITSIDNEVNERTWDQQRLSALTPWEMAWGKLLGSTAYAWYGGLLCALVIFILMLIQPDTMVRCTWLLTGLIASLALHSGLMASRLYILDIRTEKNTNSILGRLFGLFMLLQIVPGIFLFLVSLTDGEEVGSGWWRLNLSYPIQNLLLASLFLALGLLALWRSMSKQLMLHTTPWAWVVGVLSLGLIGAGYVADFVIKAIPLLVISATAIAATYFAICTEKNNLLVWQTVVFHWKNSSKRRFLQALPLWVVSCVLSLLFAGFYTLSQLGNDALDSTSVISMLSSILWLVALHCLRDCGIYLFFAFRNTTKKPLGMTVLTLFILGCILPIVFSFESESAAQFFEPMYGLKNLMYKHYSLGFTVWASMYVHLLIVSALIVWQWSKSPKAA